MRHSVAFVRHRCAQAPAIASLVLAALGVSCASPEPGPGVALYPNPESRRPDDDVAKLYGPIGSVDGQDVQGGAFDLLPGCHLVKLHTEMDRTNTYVYWSGRIPATLFAFRMRPRHRYIIRRDIAESMGGHSGRIVVTAVDEDARGSRTPVEPVRGRDDIDACRQWSADSE